MFELYLIFLTIIFGVSVILFLNSKFSRKKSSNEIFKKNDWYGSNETEISKINNSSPYREEAPELIKVPQPIVIGNPGIPNYKSNDLLILGFLIGLILLSKGK